MDSVTLRVIEDGIRSLGYSLTKLASEWERSNDLKQAQLTPSDFRAYMHIREGKQQR